MKRSPFNLLLVASFVIAALIALPVVSVLANIFSGGTGATWQHLASTVLPDYVGSTLWLCLGVGCGVVVVGVATAWLTAMHDFPGRRFFEWALVLPLAMPAYVLAYVYTDFLQFVGPLQTWLRDVFEWRRGDYWFPDVRSTGGAVAMFVFVLYPYVYLLARTAFIERASGMLEAARTLGLGPWRSFLSVSLPLARPAVVAGAALALMETLADYGTVSYFGVQTFTTGIYRAWFSLGDRVAAAQLAASLLAFVILLLLLEQVSRGRARFHNTTVRNRPHAEHALKGGAAVVALASCALPLFVGFVLPAGLLLRLALTEGDARFGARFVHLAGNSFVLAGQWALWFGANPGLLLTGGIAALIYAYLVRFLSVALQSVSASLVKVTSNMDEAARSLGENQAGVLRRVHFPLLRSSLLSAGLLVFVDVMKELPATLVMRPFNFDTLATQAYTLASDERLAEASTASLAIVAVGLLPLIFLSRQINQRR